MLGNKKKGNRDLCRIILVDIHLNKKGDFMSKVLLISTGGTVEQIRKSIEYIKPNFIIFFVRNKHIQ